MEFGENGGRFDNEIINAGNNSKSGIIIQSDLAVPYGGKFQSESSTLYLLTCFGDEIFFWINSSNQSKAYNVKTGETRYVNLPSLSTDFNEISDHKYTNISMASDSYGNIYRMDMLALTSTVIGQKLGTNEMNVAYGTSDIYNFSQNTSNKVLSISKLDGQTDIKVDLPNLPLDIDTSDVFSVTHLGDDQFLLLFLVSAATSQARSKIASCKYNAKNHSVSIVSKNITLNSLINIENSDCNFNKCICSSVVGDNVYIKNDINNERIISGWIKYNLTSNTAEFVAIESNYPNSSGFNYGFVETKDHCATAVLRGQRPNFKLVHFKDRKKF